MQVVMCTHIAVVDKEEDDTDQQIADRVMVAKDDFLRKPTRSESHYRHEIFATFQSFKACWHDALARALAILCHDLA